MHKQIFFFFTEILSELVTAEERGKAEREGECREAEEE